MTDENAVNEPKESKNNEQKGKGKGKPATKKGKDFFVDMAKEHNARVILCDARDTYIFVDFSKILNRCMNKIRNRVGYSISVEKFSEMMQEYNQMLLIMDKTIGNICKVAKVKYRPPKEIDALRKQHSAGEVDDDEVKQAS